MSRSFRSLALCLGFILFFKLLILFVKVLIIHILKSAPRHRSSLKHERVKEGLENYQWWVFIKTLCKKLCLCNGM